MRVYITLATILALGIGTTFAKICEEQSNEDLHGNNDLILIWQINFLPKSSFKSGGSGQGVKMVAWFSDSV